MANPMSLVSKKGRCGALAISLRVVRVYQTKIEKNFSGSQYDGCDPPSGMRKRE
jgi:hypothetical protein